MLKFIFFRKNKKPRSWLQSLLFGDNCRLRNFFSFLQIDDLNLFRAYFQPWYDGVLSSPYPLSDWVSARATYIEGFDFSKTRSIVIISPEATYFVAFYLKSLLEAHPSVYISISKQSPPDFDADLYFVICPQVFPVLPPPKKRIAVQMEQTVSQRWFTREYLGVLYNSLAVIEYSKVNVEYLSSLRYPMANLIHLPIRPIESPIYKPHLGQPKAYDVVFYGDDRVKRRQGFLNAIAHRFKLKVVNGLYGEDLWPVLSSAKVVVNIHYYENALLETTRISECLSLGLRVVSEEGSDQGHYAGEFPGVMFTPINDVNAMIEAIQIQLDGTEPVSQGVRTPTSHNPLLNGLSHIGIHLPR